MVEGFGMKSSLAFYGDGEAFKRVYKQGLTFCEKVKSLRGSDNYLELLKCLHYHSTGIVERKELQSLVVGLLGHDSYLIDEFNDFSENIIDFSDVVASKKRCGDHKGLSRSVKAKKNDMDQRDVRERAKQKYMDKPIREFDLSNCESCGGSYRLLPLDYPIISASERSKLDAQVLNDCWVAVPPRKKDYSCKQMQRNQYEKNLFKCEDDQFETDMLIESVRSAAKNAEELLKRIEENKGKTLVTPIEIKDHLTARNLKCINCLYGDKGPEVMDLLRENPAHQLPVILRRLRQKQEECITFRSNCSKVWAEVYAKNYHKSLNSSYSKQQDSKGSSSKSLAKEKMDESVQKEGDMHKEDDACTERGIGRENAERGVCGSAYCSWRQTTWSSQSAITI